MKEHVIETVSFKTKPGVSDEAFLAANDPVNRFLKAQPGFVGRQLSKQEDDQWLDHVEWASREQALAAAAKFPTEPSLADLGGTFDMGTVTMQHAKLMLSVS